MIDSLWQYYHDFGRHDLPWRQPELDGSFDPYKIMVSEIMLQQTQVGRVIPKFNEFLITFPTVADLAQVALAEVLKQWSGLGYNRRAKFLWQAAHMIHSDLHGDFPQTLPELVALPGIGPNTAGAILAYAYNQPALFIETNIRTVYIHHYFADQSAVPDAAIRELLAETIDADNPREFYWALMDYGTHLKQALGNFNRQSKSYAKQSTFKGSRREIRGQVLRILASGVHAEADLLAVLPDDRLLPVLADLVSEGMIKKQSKGYSL